MRELKNPFTLNSDKYSKQVFLMKSEFFYKAKNFYIVCAAFIFTRNFLKKCFLAVALAVFLTSGAFADSITSKLNEIENNYYGYNLSGNTEQRLSQIEQDLYGAVSNKSQKLRVDRIYKDLSLGVNTGAAAPVVPFYQQQDTISEKRTEDIGPKADAGIKYPVVDRLEEQVFKKAYANEDIYNRLSRLEKQVFKKESTASLNERVDALRDKLLGGNQSALAQVDPYTEEIVLDNGKKYYGNDGNDYSYGVDDSHYNYYSYENSKNHIQQPVEQQDYSDYSNYSERYAQSYDLDVLEKQLFGKRYTSDPPSQRLARLESKVFQRTFNDNEEARTQRLLAVTTAQKTSREYDSNKWAQRINTGIQIGSILLMVLAMIL